MTTNRQVKLAKRPQPGMLARDVFAIEDGPVLEPAPGQFRVKIHYVSLDPAMRGWVSDAKSYVPPVGIGEVMRAYAAGIVDASQHPDFKVGDAVQGLFGVQQYALSKGARVYKVDTSMAPLQSWIGGLGMPGWTAYFGLLEVGQPKARRHGAAGNIECIEARLPGEQAGERVVCSRRAHDLLLRQHRLEPLARRHEARRLAHQPLGHRPYSFLLFTRRPPSAMPCIRHGRPSRNACGRRP